MVYLKISAVLFAFVVLFVGEILGQYDENDDCQTQNGSEGICKFITQCPSAREDLRKGIFPKICGYSGTKSIICCVDRTVRPVVTVRPTPTPTPRPTVATTPEFKPNVGNYPGARANQMCKEFSKYAYERITSQTLSISSTFSTSLECPISTQQLIVGGTIAARREFPHMVQIGYVTGSETSWDCGGSLISARFVLTAAHCIYSISRGDAKLARAGITNQTDTYYLQQRTIIERIKYPEYNFQKYHDIALLKLDTGFNLNTYLRPACVHTQKNIPYDFVVATGWGKVDFAVEEGSQDLLKVTLEIFTTAQCNQTYRRVINMANSELPLGIIEDWMICAGSRTERKDTCQGDSGGPIQIVHKNTPDIKCMYDVVGITSFGIPCGLAKNLPGVYTRVSNYIQWIEDHVWPN